MKIKAFYWIFAFSLTVSFSTTCRADSAFLTVLKAYSDAQQKEGKETMNDDSSSNDLLKTLTDAVEKKDALDEQGRRIREQQQQTINVLMQQSSPSSARQTISSSYPQSYLTNNANSARPNSTNAPTVNECLRMEVNQYGQQGVRNVCGFSVQYSYCLQNARGLFACNANNRGQGSDGVSASGFSILPDYKNEGATGIRFVACKGKTGDVLPMLNEHGKTGCYNDVAR